MPHSIFVAYVELCTDTVLAESNENSVTSVRNKVLGFNA